MPNHYDKQMMQNAQVKGVQNFYKLKLGYKPAQMQTEQPSGMNFAVEPSYIRTGGGSNKPQGSK